jgi:hypothetical protein
VGRKPNINRQLARQNGDTYYLSDKPCKNGHFGKRRTQSGSCQECHHNAYKHKEKDYSLRSKYGITLEQYNKILKKQNGVCAICGEKETSKINKILSVDHCHNSKKVRGLLCAKCNKGIGLLKHNFKLLLKAAEYCK